jgi:hypothetical protein
MGVVAKSYMRKGFLIYSTRKSANIKLLGTDSDQNRIT